MNWWVFVKCEPKSVTINTKDLTTSVCVYWIYLIHEFHNLSWITEINELFHDILIYLDAPVDDVCHVCVSIFKNLWNKLKYKNNK